MSAAQWLAVLAVLDAHLPRNHPLTAAVQAQWQQARAREPKPAEERP